MTEVSGSLGCHCHLSCVGGICHWFCCPCPVLPDPYQHLGMLATALLNILPGRVSRAAGTPSTHFLEIIGTAAHYRVPRIQGGLGVQLGLSRATCLTEEQENPLNPLPGPGILCSVQTKISKRVNGQKSHWKEQWVLVTGGCHFGALCQPYGVISVPSGLC